MDLVIKTRSEEDLENHDYQDALIIEMDGEEVFAVRDGEPEDNNLCRNFNDCLNIDALMRAAYAAGQRGEGLTVNYEDIEE